MNAARILVDRARDAVHLGDLQRARSLLRAAAGTCRAAADAVEETRCWRLAFAVGRYAAAAAVAPGPAAALEAALTALPADTPREHGRLERGYAAALLTEGNPDAAAAALCRAADWYAEAGSPALAVRILIDGVTVLQLAGHPASAQAPARAAEAALAETDDHAAACELALLVAARAVDCGDHAGARRHAERARLEAMAGQVPAGYAAAAVTLAELTGAAGDPVDAYASLDAAWVTLRDLIGAEPASAAFEPRLLAARERWGTDDFTAVRTGPEPNRVGYLPARQKVNHR